MKKPTKIVKEVDEEPELPYSHKKEKSQYYGMSREDKMKMTLKRIEEDKLQAAHKLPLLKKNEVKKKLFINKKKVYDLANGYPICVSKIADKDAYFYGLSNGTVVYFDPKSEKISTAVKGDSPILDILGLSNDRIVTVDDYSKVKVYDQYKLVKVVAARAMFVTGTYSYSKILVGTDRFCFFINENRDGVVKVNLDEHTEETLDFGKPNLFQLALVDEKIFALTEDGWLIMATLLELNRMTADETEALPESGMTLAEVKIEALTNEQMGIAVKTHNAEEQLEASIMVDGESVLLNTSGVDAMGESQAAPEKTKSQEGKERMDRVFNIPVVNKFFRTIAASQDLVAVVGSDGQGHNVLFVYTHKLTLKAYKYLRIEPHDYCFNLTKTIHKLEIVQRKECTYIFGVTHKKDYKLYVWKLEGDELTLFKRYRPIHSNLITDLRADTDTLVTASRDKKVNFYFLDYRFDQK